ncbi:hypothetical protein MA16_Dca027318 [Dendrobium catenatum]|uniref:Uncharacterized protein n=1 Tax=Dendrobium catenatum TaxID=906689 RepID=A0A2I0WP61_9ASPA|nr:hypothetical protein MA16_Dca027318 [Dendrobium catenatum]
MNSNQGIHRHLMKRQGGLVIKEIAEPMPMVIKQVEGKGKAVIDMVDMVTPNNSLEKKFQNSGNSTCSNLELIQKSFNNTGGKGCLRSQVNPKGLLANSSIPYHNPEKKIQEKVIKQLAVQNSSVIDLDINYVINNMNVQKRGNTSEIIPDNLIEEGVVNDLQSNNRFSILLLNREVDKADKSENSLVENRELEELETEDDKTGEIVKNQKDLVENFVCGEVTFKLQKELKSLGNNSMKSKTRKGENKNVCSGSNPTSKKK